MILERIFKPKWQHIDPEQRLQALEELDVNDSALKELAREDDAPAVRVAAIRRLIDLDLLDQLATQDGDETVREAAKIRYGQLLCGEVGQYDLAQRQTRLATAEGATRSYVARNAAEPELRLAALAQVELEQQTLLAIALEDAAPQVKLAAAERLHELEALEQVAKASRNKDKRLYRLVRTKLDAAKAEKELFATLTKLCERLEALAEDTGVSPNDTRLFALEQEWRNHEEAPESLQLRFNEALERIRQRQGETTEQRAARLGLHGALEDLQRRLDEASALDDELDAAAHELIAKAEGFLQGEGEEVQVEQQRVERLLAMVKRRRSELAQWRERAARLQALIEQAEGLQKDKPHPPRERDLERLRARWQEAQGNEAGEQIGALRNTFEALIGSIAQRLEQQKSQQSEIVQAIEEQIKALREVLEAGEINRANELEEQIRQAIKSSPLSREQKGKFNDQLNSLRGVLGELRAWRRWGTHQARDNLCAEAEQLIEAPLEPPEIAKRVQQLREQWKEMDHREGAASKNLWERFNTACEKAYEPCIAHFEQQAKERQANLNKRLELCAQLEALDVETDWDDVDWRGVDRKRNEINNAWRRVGPVDRAERKGIEKRYRKALQKMDQRLNGERERDIKRREGLISRVEALTEQEDLRAAIEGAKQAQSEWQPTVLASRRREQELWQRFRAACDAIFNRRQVQLEAAESERRKNRDAKAALCEELEALIESDSEQFEQRRSRVGAIRGQWSDIGPVPRNEQNALERRFEAALKGVERRNQQLERQKRRQSMERLRDRAERCSALEALLWDEDADVFAAAEAAKEAWASLPPLGRKAFEPIDERFERVYQALTGEESQREALRKQLLDNLKAKQTLCLRMEILAEIESPPEFAQARMAYQVARLSESLANRESHSPEKEAETVEQSWYLTPFPASEEADRLTKRFERALTAFHLQRESNQRQATV